MKKLLLIILAIIAILFSENSFAQEIKSTCDSTIVRLSDDFKIVTGNYDGDVAISIGGYRINVTEQNAKITTRPKKSFSIDLLGDYEFGLTNTTSAPSTSPYAAAVDFKSGFHFGMNLIKMNFMLDQAQRVNLHIGLKLISNDYIFDNYNTLLTQDGEVIVLPISESTKKSKLNAHYFGIPVGLEFEIAPRLILEPEVSFDMLASSHTKYKKPKVKNNFSAVNDFTITTTLRLKYKGFGFYVQYSPTPLFDTNILPEVMPYSFGVVLF